MLGALIAALIAAVLWWVVATLPPKNFPPGPRFPLPVVGDALKIGKNLVKGTELS